MKRGASGVRLNAREVVVAAFRTLRVRWFEFLRALAVPAMGLSLIEYLTSYDVTTTWKFVLPQLVALLLYVLFAVTCHRLVLKRSGDVPAYGQLMWAWRETWFATWLVGITILAVLAVAPIYTIMISWVGTDPDPEHPLMWLFYVVLLPFYFLLARLSLVLPAVAVDERPNLPWAWRLGRGNSLPLFILVGILPWLSTLALASLHRDNASIPESVMLNLVGLAVLAFEIVLLSFAYRVLTGGSLAVRGHAR